MICGNCSVCHKEFWAKGIAQKTCSIECALELKEEISRLRECARIDRDQLGIEETRTPIRSIEDARQLMTERRIKLALIESSFDAKKLFKEHEHILKDVPEKSA